MLCKKKLLGLALCLTFVIIQVNCEDVAVAGGDNELNKAATSEPSSEISEYEVSATGLELEHELVNDQAGSTSGEQFVAIPKDMPLGHKEILAPNLLGLTTMGMTFLPKHLKLLNVVSATREIVAGVKYELVVNALTESQEREVCALDILEKPWILNSWGEKLKILKNTNCTGEGITIDHEDSDQRINPLFYRKPPQKLSDDQMKDLVKQILPSNRKKVENPILTSTESPEELKPSSELDDSVKKALDKFFDMAAPNEVAKAVQRTPVEQENVPQPQSQDSDSVTPVPEVTTSTTNSIPPQAAMDNLYYNSNGNSNTPPPEIIALSQSEDVNTQQHVVDPFFDPQQSSVQSPISSRRKRQIAECKNKPYQFKKGGCLPAKKQKRQLKGGPKTVDADDPELNQIVRDALKTLKEQDQTFDYELVRIKDAKYQTVAGSLHTFDLELKNQQESGVTCEMKVWYRPWIDEKARNVTTVCGEKTYKHVLRTKRSSGPIVGGPREIENPQNDVEIQSFVNEALVSYNAGKEEHTLLKIERATVQVVAGSLHKIYVQFKNNKDVKSCVISVWNRSWLPNGKETKVNCEGEDELTTRSKRSSEPVLGGPKEIENPENNVEVQSFVNEALVSYNAGKEEHTLLKINRATIQVVAGTLHKIYVQFKNDEQVKSCVISVWNRSWLPNGKETKVNCEGEDELVSRSKRSSDVGFGFGGAKEIENPENNEKIKGFVNEALVSYNAGKDEHTLLKIERATIQVVAGTIHKIYVQFKNDKQVKSCVISVFDRSWEPKTKETKVTCEGEDEVVKRSKRSSVPVLGGPQEIENPQNNVEIQSFVNEALVSYNTGKDKHSLLKIERATVQVVAGTLHKIYVQFKKGKHVKSCVISVFDRSWTPKTKETKVNCEGEDEHVKRSKRSSVPVLGGPQEIENPQNNIEIQSFVNEALVSYNTGKDKHTLLKIERATVQVVAGTLHKIYVQFKKGKHAKSCVISVYDRSWSKTKEIKVNCEGEDEHVKRNKRSSNPIVGGPKEIENPENNVEVQSYVNEALVSYNAGKDEHTLLKIERATIQVVAGTLHKIYVQFKTGKQVKSCVVSVWNRSWLTNGKETTVNCDGETEHKFRSKRSLKFDHRKPLLEHETAVDNSELHELLFKKFQQKHGRHYSSTIERQLRFRIFKQNLEKIEELNSKERGTAKYGINQFADMTSTEFKKHTGMRHRPEHNHIRNPKAEIPDIQLPTAFDWRDKGAVSQVKNQGSCGSCWAFSVIGNIEGLNAIKTGNMEEFSEQELVDCDELDHGCNGGLPDDAYKAIEQLGGLESEANYPYTAKQGKCHMNKTLIDVKVKGAVDLPKNETQMAQWLIENGPISIGINANAMQFYRAGISHPYHFLCRAGKIDHGVLIVGFGVAEYPLFNKTLPYWIVKNSWGPQWGEKGFYRVFRGDNTCGVSEMASSAVLE